MAAGMDSGDLFDEDLAAETGVEVAIAEGSKEGSDYVITMRDAKDPNSPALVFTPAEWEAFVAGVKDGEFDLEDGDFDEDEDFDEDYDEEDLDEDDADDGEEEHAGEEGPGEQGRGGDVRDRRGE